MLRVREGRSGEREKNEELKGWRKGEGKGGMGRLMQGKVGGEKRRHRGIS